MEDSAQATQDLGGSEPVAEIACDGQRLSKVMQGGVDLLEVRIDQCAAGRRALSGQTGRVGGRRVPAGPGAHYRRCHPPGLPRLPNGVFRLALGCAAGEVCRYDTRGSLFTRELTRR